MPEPQTKSDARERARAAARSVSPTARRKHAKELAEAKAEVARLEKLAARAARRDYLRKAGEIARGEA